MHKSGLPHYGTMWCGSRKVHGPHEWKWTIDGLRPETVQMSCDGATEKELHQEEKTLACRLCGGTTEHTFSCTPARRNLYERNN